jgi:hypothetical protein
MRYEIISAPEEANDLKRIDAHLRTEIREALERHLRREPTKIGISHDPAKGGISGPR